MSPDEILRNGIDYGVAMSDYDLWRQYNPILMGTMEEICKASFMAGRQSMRESILNEFGCLKSGDMQWLAKAIGDCK